MIKKSGFALCIPFLFIFSFLLGSQELPKLQKASEVVTGTLPNGISYYLVKNSASNGFADFALVQRGAVSEDVSRESLTSLGVFLNRKPYQYLAKLGVGYKKYGMIRPGGTSTVYHFEDVPVSEQNSRDTTLLMIFGLCDLYPYDQAIVVAGDIDQNAMKQKMDVLSMMVSARSKADPAADYEWKPSGMLSYEAEHTHPYAQTVISVNCSASRTPKDVMNTVQPLVSEIFAKEFGSILSDRVEIRFRKEGIPVAGSEFVYRSSADGPYEENYRFEVTVPNQEAEHAVELLSELLSEFREGGASASELQTAKDELLSYAKRMSSEVVVDNGEWIRKCTSAYLYGSNLASPSTVSDFFISRALSSDRELTLFNNFVKALVDPATGMTIGCASSSPLSRETAISASQRGWKQGSTKANTISYSLNQNDTLSFSVPKSKVKLKNTVSEPLTGGEMWTFSNGMRVIFKKSGPKGQFSYGMLLNGGIADVENIRQGEGGFIGDMLLLNDFAGFSSTGFSRMLDANGISMKVKADLSHLGISGSAPVSSFNLLMKSLLAVANDRKTTEGSYEYYRESEKLRLSVLKRQQEGVDAVIDSIMCPDYRYSLAKLESGLSDDLPQRAEKYFASRFEKCNDGILVIVGDLDPYALKKSLSTYLSGFKVGKADTVRPQLSYTLRSGWSTYTVDAEESGLGDGEPSVNVAVSALLPFTVERYSAFQVASVELKRKLVETLADYGMVVEVNTSFDILPQERYNLSISCRPADEKGLPSNVSPESPLRVLGVVRRAFDEFISQGVPEQAVKSAKTAMISRRVAELALPEKVVDYTMMRYSLGKDMVSSYKDRINAVNSASIKELLLALDGGSKVEYVFY